VGILVRELKAQRPPQGEEVTTQGGRLGFNGNRRGAGCREPGSETTRGGASGSGIGFAGFNIPATVPFDIQCDTDVCVRIRTYGHAAQFEGRGTRFFEDRGFGIGIGSRTGFSTQGIR
jgi:hypothetical protein